MNPTDDKVLFERVKEGDEKAFEKLFHGYYNFLCLFATKIISDDKAAEEIVQDFFVKLWDKKEQIKINTSIKNYFFQSIKNLCLNYIKHNAIKEKYANFKGNEPDSDLNFESDFIEIDLAVKIEESINSLPEKRREIFRLNREDGLKYKEIAKKLNISIKTVETQMGLAIKTLREKLKNYIPLLSLLFVFLNK